MAFWEKWQLWEKMCFVLAASIVGVIAGGSVKLLYSRWRLRKYTAIAATKDAQRKEMMQIEGATKRRAPDIPFGVRAIESGIEVDGVWISRSNTPNTSLPGSPAYSESSEQNFGNNGVSSEGPSPTPNASRLKVPQPTLNPSPAKSGTSSRPLSSSFDRAVSAEIIPSRLSSSDFTSRGRHTYQPRRSSHLRFSNSHDNDSSDALAALEGRHLVTTTRKSQAAVDHTNSGSSESWSESSSSEGHSGSSGSTKPSRMRTSHDRLDPADASYHNTSASKRRALDTLPSQRRSQVVETGQFIPRSRQSAANGDWAEATTPAEHRYTFTQHPSPYIDLGDLFATPRQDEQTQEPPPFQNFVNQSPHGARSDMTETQTTRHHRSQKARNSQVEQGINSRFEILQPGALDRPRPSSDIADWKQDLEGGNKHQWRRLQRRRGDSNGTESRFIEEVW